MVRIVYVKNVCYEVILKHNFDKDDFLYRTAYFEDRSR